MGAPHLLHVFATFTASGPQIRASELIHAFGAEFRHSIIGMDGRTDAMALLDDAPQATLLATPPAGTVNRIRRLRGLLRRGEPGVCDRPDLLLTYNWGSFDAVLAARSATARPHVHHEDGFNQDEVDRQKTRRVFARRVLLRGCSRVVVCSHRLLDIATSTWRLPRDKTCLIPNGIHAERFQGGDGRPVREGLGIPRDALVIGTVGHLRPVKNFARLLAAAARVDATRVRRPIHVILVGDGELRADLEKQARAAPPPGGRVHFPGHRRDLRDFYAAMDLFSLTSDSEQHPVALLEAMAAGLAAAATDVGDIHAVLPDRQRRFLVPADVEAPGRLAERFTELLANDDLRAELGRRNALRVQEEYTFDSMVTAYRAVYQAAIDATFDDAA